MWPRRSETLCVGLSLAQVDWGLAGSTSSSASLPVPDAPFEHVLAMIDEPSMPSRVSAVHLVAGSGLARHWLQSAPPGLRTLSELRELVQSRADQLFGGDPGWVVAADWHATRPFLCAALPQGVERLASAVARTRRATPHLATSLSLALAQHARSLPVDGWAVLHEPEALHLLYFSTGQLEYLRTATVQAGLHGLALQSEAGAEVARCSALAGGLPASPPTIISMSKDPATTQSAAAMSLATRASGGRAS